MHCWSRILLKTDTVCRSYDNVYTGLLFPGHSVLCRFVKKQNDNDGSSLNRIYELQEKILRLKFNMSGTLKRIVHCQQRAGRYHSPASAAVAAAATDDAVVQWRLVDDL